MTTWELAKAIALGLVLFELIKFGWTALMAAVLLALGYRK